MDRREIIFNILHEFPNGKGVEVGAYEGEFSREITERWNGTLYMVDVWRSLDGNEYSDKSNQDNIYQKAIENTKGFEDRAIMLRCTSLQAVELFEDESLDFVYIDANHAYDYVKQDMKAWYPKVKKNGYFCGHDYLDMYWYNNEELMENGKDKNIYAENGKYYGVFGVNPAVDEFCQEYDYSLKLSDEFFNTWMIRRK